MPLHCTCLNPECRKRFAVPEGMEGKLTPCPACGTPQIMPSQAMAEKDEALDTLPLADPPRGPDDDLVPVGEMDEGEEPLAGPRRRPLPPGERERITHIAAVRDTRGRLLVRLGLLGGLLLVGWVVYSQVSLFFARHKVRDLLHQLARDGRNQAVVAELAERLPFVIDHCNDLYASEPRDELIHLTNGLRALFSRIPKDQDVAPLLELTPEAGLAHKAALIAVRRRADRAWLIEQSCQGSANARRSAVEALRPTFPLGKLSDEDAARLARPTSVEEKKERIEEVYGAIHRRLEEQWTGSYRLRLDAAWRFPERPATEHQWTSAAPVVTVACADRTWRVKLLGEAWSGPIEKLEQMRLTAPVGQISDQGLGQPPFSLLRAAKLSLGFRDGFVVTVGDFPRYRRQTTGSTPTSSPSRIPKGAHVLGKAVGRHLGMPAPVYRWLLPPKPGFSKLEAELIKH